MNFYYIFIIQGDEMELLTYIFIALLVVIWLAFIFLIFIVIELYKMFKI